MGFGRERRVELRIGFLVKREGCAILGIADFAGAVGGTNEREGFTFRAGLGELLRRPGCSCVTLQSV